MLWAVAAFGAGTVAFCLSTTFLLSLALLVVMGAADMFSVFVRGTLIQLNTPDHMRGRVSAASGLAISASNELGEMRAGAMAAVLGPVSAAVSYTHLDVYKRQASFIIAARTIGIGGPP